MRSFRLPCIGEVDNEVSIRIVVYFLFIFVTYISLRKGGLILDWLGVFKHVLTAP